MLLDSITVLAKSLATIVTVHSFCCPGLYGLGRCSSECCYQKGPLIACSAMLVGLCDVSTVAKPLQGRWGPQCLGVDDVSLSHKCTWFLEVLVKV